MADNLQRWRQSGSASQAGVGKTTPPAKRGKALVLMGVILALAGAIAAWMLYPRELEPPYALSLWISEQKEPPNAWVTADRNAFHAALPDARNGFPSQRTALFRQELEGISKQKNDRVIVSLSAPARPLPGGGVGLILADSELDDPGTWFRAADVFQILREKDSENKQKLVLLDLTQPFSDARLGILTRDVADHLEPVLQEAVKADPKLRILVACSPGQVSLASEELGHTAFAHFVLEGLTTTRADRNSDGRLSVDELGGFVAVQVDRWASLARGQRQTPRLLGEGKDFDLRALGSDLKPHQPAPLTAEYPVWLADGWKKRDAWWKDDSYRVILPEFQQFPLHLLRAELRWRNGGDEERLREDLRRRLDDLEFKRKSELARLVKPETRSLAFVVRDKKLGDVSLEAVRKLAKLADLDAQFRKLPKPTDADKERRDKEVAAFLKEYEAKEPDKQGEKNLELTRVILAAAADEPEPSKSMLELLAGLLPKDSEKSYAEAALLRKLAAMEAMTPWPGKTVALALKTVGEAESAKLAEPRARPWVEKPLRDGLLRFDAGTGALARGRPEEAETELRQAVPLLEKANKDVKVVADAQDTRDQALALLPSYVPYFETADDSVAASAWDRVIDTACDLRDLLAAPPPGGVLPDATVVTLRDLTYQYHDTTYAGKLRQPMRPEAFKKMLERAEKPADAHALSDYLLLTWHPAAQRQELWKSWRELTGRLQGRLAEQTGSPPAWTEADQKRARLAEHERAEWRGRLAVSLLKLEGRANWRELKALADKAAGDPGDATLRELEAKLRTAWKK